MAWNKVQSFAQVAQFGPTAVNNTQVTLGSPVAVGDTLCVFTTVVADDAAYVASVTDSLGNTYTRRKRLYSATDDQSGGWWECRVTVAGTPTITYDPDTALQPWIALIGDHFTGSDAASAFRDAQAQANVTPGTGADALASPSIAAQSGDLLWGANMNTRNSAHGTQTAGTGFSLGGQATAFITDYRTASGAAAATFTDATNGGTDVYLTGGLAVTPATGGGAPQRTLLGVGQ